MCVCSHTPGLFLVSFSYIWYVSLSFCDRVSLSKLSEVKVTVCSAFAHSVTVSVGVWGCAARLPASANLSHICHTSKLLPFWLLLLRSTLFHKGSLNRLVVAKPEWVKSNINVWEKLSTILCRICKYWTLVEGFVCVFSGIKSYTKQVQWIV